LITAGISSFIGQIAVSPWLSWMADLVPENRRGAFWGKRQGISTISFLLALAGAGWILDRFPDGSLIGFSIVFAVATLFGCMDILLHGLVPEPAQAPIEPNHRPMQRILAPLRNRDFRRFTIAMAVWGFGLAMVGQFGNVYLKQVFKMPYSQISFIQITTSVGGIIASFVAATLMDRMGSRVFAALTVLLAPVFNFAWIFIKPEALWLGLPQSVLLLSSTGILTGGVVAGIFICQVNMASILTPASGRTMAMAVHWSIVGLVSAVGPLFGGQLMDHFIAHPSSLILPNGMPFSYIHAILLIHLVIAWVITLPLFASIRLRTRDIGVSVAVKNVVLANPLRLVRDLYNIHISMASVPSQRKAQAIQELGKTRSPMVAADLAAMLEDPAVEVREKAVTALGKIGGEEALDVLLKTLEDSHQADLAPQIARALRQIGSPKSVEALTRQLITGDRETKSESVRALGKIADRRAKEPLLKLLREETDEKLISHSSDALAQLQEQVAVYEIFPRMRRTENRILRRSLATTLGSFFGESDAFYRLFSKELQNPGSQIDGLLKRIGRRIDKNPHAGRPAKQNFDSFQQAYDLHRWPDCIEALLQLSQQIARQDFGNNRLEKIEQQHPIAGLILWLVEQLHKQRNKELRLVEVLLGLYVLSCWPKQKNNKNNF
jgi:MFS family permease